MRLDGSVTEDLLDDAVGALIGRSSVRSGPRHNRLQMQDVNDLNQAHLDRDPLSFLGVPVPEQALQGCLDWTTWSAQFSSKIAD